MLYLKHLNINLIVKNMYITRTISMYNMFIEQLNKRAILKLSGPDTVNYLQSMITNDVKRFENSSAMYSLMLNARGKVLYDTLLYRINESEYFVEYDSNAVEYLHKHLFMYRLRKNVDIKPLSDLIAWVIYTDCENTDPIFYTYLETLTNSAIKQNGVITSVIDPRTNLLGVRVITKKDTNLLKMLTHKNLKFKQGFCYRVFRYKLGIGEGVIDHPTGVCLPLETNVDFLNGVSFTKGCYIGQELTARSHFTLNVRKRLVPVILESRDIYPEFPPECSIVNDKGEKLGRLRSNVKQFGLAVLKYEDCVKSKYLLIKDFNLKLETFKPKWWPKDM